MPRASLCRRWADFVPLPLPAGEVLVGSIVAVSTDLTVDLVLYYATRTGSRGVLNIVTVPQGRAGSLTLGLPIYHVIGHVRLSTSRNSLRLDNTSVCFGTAQDTDRALGVPSRVGRRRAAS